MSQLTKNLLGRWSIWRADKDSADTVFPSSHFDAVPGFTEAVRKHILRSVKATFQKVTRSTLAEYLRMDGAALDELVTSQSKLDTGLPVSDRRELRNMLSLHQGS